MKKIVIQMKQKSNKNVTNFKTFVAVAHIDIHTGSCLLTEKTQFYKIITNKKVTKRTGPFVTKIRGEKICLNIR